MDELLYRQVRGIFVGVLFVIMGITLYNNPSKGVVAYIELIYSVEFLSAFFAISGLMIASQGLMGHEHNALWYTPVFAYTLATYVYYTQSGIPFFTVLVYTLLSILFILEIGRDVIGEHYGKRIGNSRV